MSEKQAGRKYKLTLIAMAAMLTAFGTTTLNATLAGAYSELLTGIVTLCLAYFGGNVGNKFVTSKQVTPVVNTTQLTSNTTTKVP